MLRSLQALKKSIIQAVDGEIGSVEEFLFDDDRWAVRYLVVNTGSWLTGKKVLLSPLSVLGMDPTTNGIRVSLTLQQIKDSPEVDSEKPVSRQWEAKYHDYYKWPYYWAGSGVWGLAASPSGMMGLPYLDPSPVQLKEDVPKKQNPHLRSTVAVRGYGIEATDRDFGEVEDFIMDDESWVIRYLVIDTVKFWPSKAVVISPQWINSIRWLDRRISVDLTEDKIRECPEYHSESFINRAMEQRLYDYYGRPRYWEPTEATLAQNRFLL